ncbi:hypothetical protein [Anderseniella sp. Alg231-50]|uniref:hypothetical protein n=1 Tax=Anderseniella sp. Alg231-50 TaxID=1922226 RepID=UPI000D54EF3D
MRLLIHIGAVVFLTLLTQVGGLAWIGTAVMARRLANRRLVILGVFGAIYAGLSLAAATAAPVFGRVALPCLATGQSTLAMQSPLYCVLNRHYVSKPMYDTANKLAADMNRQFPGTLTQALDGSFPFLDGFPLLPHLSHNDGNKLDIAFYYGDPSTQKYIRGKTRSPIGYWGFERPERGADLPCEGRRDILTGRWDMSWFQIFNSVVVLDRPRTRAALEWLTAPDGGRKAGVTKIFIEPHLANSLGVKDDILRFQGCRAARHDDHIHSQVKK